MRYLDPVILYRPQRNKSQIVPIFSYGTLDDQNRAVFYYRWIEARTYQVRRLETHEDPPKDQLPHLRSVRYKGRQKHVRGDFDRYLQVMPQDASFKVEMLLPDEDTAVSRYAKLDHEKQRLSPEYQKIVKNFCRILDAHFLDAEAAKLAGESLTLFFKGLSIGRSKSTFSFFMKGIKDTYDALGFYRSTYRGLRLHNFGFNDLLSYVRKLREAYPKSLQIDYDLVPGFKKLSARQLRGPSEPPPYTIPMSDGAFKGIPAPYLRIIKETMAHWVDKNQRMPMRSKQGKVQPSKVFSSGFVRGTTDEPVIVHEYGFRGDGRSPLVVLTSGGLHPNAIRHYESQRDQTKFEKYRRELERRAKDRYADLQNPHFDPWLHQHNYDAISVFLSVSRSPDVALSFINMGGGNGHIYVIRAVGAIDQEATFRRVQYGGERELSLPGGVDWQEIIAARPVVNGVPLDYCYYNTNNKWRLKEKAPQLKALRALMNIQIALDFDF